jgi:DEAD/DEAH box helicase domain-containing protein
VSQDASLGEFLRALQADNRYAGQLVHLVQQPGRRAAYGELSAPLAPPVAKILDDLGRSRLYQHQVQALEAVRRGENVVVSAGTAAGKTLCYIIPVAQALAEDRQARALLIYPTKALAQDQLNKLADFGAGQAFLADTYDGDTPPQRRREIRRSTQVILTNPDMLHVALLPNHARWAEFFAHLRYVVVDEVHVYRGVFGSQMGNVLRRLRRICDHYGARPQFICSSATIGNPGELGETLVGQPFTVVEEDTAPRGPRYWAFWNPPLVEAKLGRRRSPNREAADLIARLVRAGIRTLAFTLSRMQTEMVLRYTRERLSDSPSLQERVAPYRGGYLPEERRLIERRLFSGELLAVVATSALELGVDIGGLDAVISIGYPGDLASLRQQAGRAGRARQESLAVLLAAGGGVDQYLMEHPEYVLDAGHDRALCAPGNRFILGGHLLCAAYELPLEPSDERYFGPEMASILDVLTEHGLLDRRRRWYWSDPERYPAAELGLRSGSGRGYEIILDAPHRLIGTVDESSALWLVHPGAVYLHQGETYVVQSLDLERKTALVSKQDVKYVTRAVSVSEIHIAEQFQERGFGATGVSPVAADGGDGRDARPTGMRYGVPRLHLGEVSVTSRIVGYRRLQAVRRGRGEDEVQIEQEIVPLELPQSDFETVGLWLTAGRELGPLQKQGHDVLGSLHALEHALIGLMPLLVMCDPHDVGGVSSLFHPDTGEATICLYDGYPGGVGLSEDAYDKAEALLEATAERIEKCPCAQGCPACVQSPSCGDNNQPLDKQGAARLARLWLSSA